MKKIPVNIISGFLGSGKTTAILKLLDQKPMDEMWAVIINEFGKISIDSQTLQSKSVAGSVFDISGGCICCSARGYFHENLDRILQSERFDRIIIEPSGLGGIDLVSEIVSSFPQLKLMPTICLVDITAIENSRMQLNPIYRMQILKAELIVFTKCDLVPDSTRQDQLIHLFITLNRDRLSDIYFKGDDFSVELLMIDHPAAIIPAGFKIIVPVSQMLTDSNYEELNLISPSEDIFSKEKVTRFLKEHPQIIRAKGHLLTEAGWKRVNYTLSGLLFETCEAKVQNELVMIMEKPGSLVYPEGEEAALLVDRSVMRSWLLAAGS